MKIIHHHNNNTMYFSISKSTATGQLLAHFLKKQRDLLMEYKEVAYQLSDMSDPDFIISNRTFLAELAGIQFRFHPGRDWAEIKGEFYTRRFFRPSANAVKKKKENYLKFTEHRSQIPTKSLLQTMGLKEGIVPSDIRRWYHLPAINDKAEHILVEIPDPWALHYASQRPCDMIEITATDFHKLLELPETA